MSNIYCFYCHKYKPASVFLVPKGQRRKCDVCSEASKLAMKGKK